MDPRARLRTEATVMHLDLDAFFASVEQRDKPSLRGKPVVVGGTGGRGVVAAASYEAREFGVTSAMSTREARARCPHAAYLSGRFDAYRATSEAVMALLRSVSPLVEPLSLDEAFVDLEPAGLPDLTAATLTAFAEELRDRVHQVSGGLTASVGIASSKFVAKVASDLDKPDGLVVVAPGTERALLDPMSVTVVPGVGPATATRLRRVGMHTVADLAAVSRDELVRLVGQAHGTALTELAHARDDRAVVPEREAKSLSTEDTYDTDVTDPGLLAHLAHRYAGQVAGRLQQQGLAGRTVTLKVRLHDFTTLSRAQTLPSPTDQHRVIARTAQRLLAELDTADGVRLLGVGVAGLTDWIQEDLFGDADPDPEPAGTDTDPGPPAAGPPAPGTDGGVPLARTRTWAPGSDVTHRERGRGWVWGSGRGVVTVRFETAASPAGPVRSFDADDPDLGPAAPLGPDGEPVGDDAAPERTDGH